MPRLDALRDRLDRLAMAEAVILLEDRGASASRLGELRRRYREAGLEVRSVRTSHLRRALLGTPFEVLLDACVGQLLLIVVDRDPARAAELTRTLLGWHEHLRVRACAIAGERIVLDAMTKAPSLFDRRRALVRVLKQIPRRLVTVLAQRDDQHVALGQLQWLRRRLANLLAGPRGRDDDRGTWTECRIDAEAIFASFTCVRLRHGWRLRAHAFRQGGNGNGVVWAIPPGAPDPEPFGTQYGSLFEPPRPPEARSVSEAIEADDDNPWSYICVSILLREFAEFGALWHGVGWGAHHLVDALPPEQEWTVLEPLPRSLFDGGHSAGRPRAGKAVTSLPPVRSRNAPFGFRTQPNANRDAATAARVRFELESRGDTRDATRSAIR